MGIISLYAAYKYGQRKAERKYMEEICDNCGYAREDHIDPEDACLCPE